MPFTLSHAAAAWPFRRTRLDLSALLVGCFVPDLLYFLFLKHGFDPHSLPGLFAFDLPVGLVSLWLFHSYVKRPSLIFVPDGIRRRLKAGAFSFMPPTRLALIALSILIGSATHILWDSFTHRFYWPYRHWSFLRLTVPFPILGQIVMYKLLQYASSVGGAVAVGLWVWHWYRKTAPVEHPIAPLCTGAQRFAIMLTLPVAAIWGGIYRAHEVIRNLHGAKPVANFTADAVITAITIFGLGLLACGIILGGRQAEKEHAQTNREG